MPLFATLIAAFTIGEMLTTANAGGVVLVVVGTAAISWETANADAAHLEDVSLLDVAVPVLVAIAFATEPTLVRVGYSEGTPVLVG